ncbi:hypothetical protein [Nocardia macrotermitis]|uniref:ABC transmembrane type-1 domain-containing protein n=1 Tax=Nocardia macrotermitis TaxID=2585198 RepID=A0A7K0D522_9NOCA|nr:hypothetical protein [Nocardia macrotermitis]MQY20846.1 hypothetical protein [Nocardia macrotermitis]
MSVDRIEANGLEMELAPRRLSGRLIGGWYLRGLVAVVVQLPALALGALVLTPTAWSIAVVVLSPRYRFVTVCSAAVICAVWTWRQLWSPTTESADGTSPGPAASGSAGSAQSAARGPVRNGSAESGPPGVAESGSRESVPSGSAGVAVSGLPRPRGSGSWGSAESCPAGGEEGEPMVSGSPGLPDRESGKGGSGRSTRRGSGRRRWVPYWPELGVWLAWLAGAVGAGVHYGARGNWGWAEAAGVGAVLLGVWWWLGRRGTRRWYWAALLPGVVVAAGMIAAIVATAGSEAYWMTVVWVGATFGLLVFTVWMAWLLRRTWWPWWPLIVPFGVSAFVAGLAWRLIFEPIVDPVTSVKMQAFLYALMLGAAFAWIWFGALFVLLRAAAASIESDPVRRAYLERRTGIRRYWRLVVMLNPVIMIVGLVVTVAAARVFDIILVGVPGPLQYTLDSVTVHWWHLPSDTAADHVAAAAFSLPLALVVGVVAWFLQVGIRRHHARWPAPGPAAVPVRLRIPVSGVSGPRLARHEIWILTCARGVGIGFAKCWAPVRSVLGRRVERIANNGKTLAAQDDPPLGTRPAERRLVAVVRASRLSFRIGAVPLAALAPLVVLFVMTWAGFDGPALIGARSIWGDTELWRGLIDTGVVAVVATFLTVSAALPPAYYAATLRPDKLPSRALMTCLVVFAVLPAQVYLGPIRAVIVRYDLAGTSIPLILMHAAIGLPIAIMILRGALLAPADGPLSDTRREPASTSIMVRSVLHSAGPALVAVAVLQLVQVWNDFFIGLQVRGADASPWSLLLWSDARQFHESTAHLAAGALLSAVPPVVLLLATWRRFLVPGLTGGALR